MRVLADSNIVAQAVRAMRAAGHDVVYVGDRTADPGDLALLAEAEADGRVLLTKDNDFGALVTEIGSRIQAWCWSTIRVMPAPKPA